MKNKRKNNILGEIIYGSLMGVFFIALNLAEEDNLTTNKILKAVGLGIVLALISTLIFGWLMRRFEKSRFVKEGTAIELPDNETMLYNGAANHFKGMEAVGGRLYLTDKQLIFKSHKLNIQNHELRMPLNTLTRVERVKTLKIINNGLIIQQHEYEPEKFVVQNAAEWLRKILMARNGIVQVDYRD